MIVKHKRQFVLSVICGVVFSFLKKLGLHALLKHVNVMSIRTLYQRILMSERFFLFVKSKSYVPYNCSFIISDKDSNKQCCKFIRTCVGTK